MLQRISAQAGLREIQHIIKTHKIMNRRTLLKTGTLAGIAALLPTSSLFARPSEVVDTKDDKDFSGFRKLKLGDLDLYILSDGFIREENVNTYCPRANVTELKNILKDNFRSQDYIDMAINVLLVKKDNQLILLDSGLGIFADQNNGFLLKSLAKAGFTPNQITDVFISHAHPDHVGGLLDKNNQFFFPNAKYYISQIEYNFWMKATEKDFKNSGLIHELDFLKMFIPKVQSILTTLKPKLGYYNYQKPLFDNFTFVLAPGHTPGMTLTKIKSANEELMVVADLIHSDILLFPHPEWGFSGDTDLDIAISSRRKILTELATTKTRTLCYHLPYTGLGYVKKSGSAFQWIQEAVFVP